FISWGDIMKATIRRSVLPAALAFALAASFSLPALAQDGAQDGADKSITQLQGIEVTGTRIKGADMATQVPVFTIGADEIAKTGLTSVGDILQQLSAAGS